MIRKRVVVSGRVQGVYFRDSCRRFATGLGVTGWVRNRSDGRVEAVFEGHADAVSQMVEWCRHGPSHAVVRSVETFDEQPEGLQHFDIQ